MTFSALGWNPAPGEPDVVRRSSAELTGVAEIAEDAGAVLRAISSGGALSTWNGAAAEKFRVTLDQLCADLGLLQRSYHDASAALAAYASGLDSAQQEALRAAADATTATADRDEADHRVGTATTEARAQASMANQAVLRANGANAQLALAAATGDAVAADEQTRKLQQEQRTFRQASSMRDQANQRAQEARLRRGDAANKLAAAKVLGSHAQELREEAARRAEKALHAASEQGIQPLDPLTKLWDSTREFVGSKGFDDFLTTLSTVGGLLNDIALPLTIVCAGIGLLGGPAGFAAGLALGNALSRVGTAMQGAAFVGRLAQASFNREHEGELRDAALAFGSGLIGIKGFGGGKGFGGAGKDVSELGGLVKRDLASADNRTLHGAARKWLWEPVTVAPKTLPPSTTHLAERFPVLGPMTDRTVGTAALTASELVLDSYKIPGALSEAPLDLSRPPSRGVVEDTTPESLGDFGTSVVIEGFRRMLP